MKELKGKGHTRVIHVAVLAASITASISLFGTLPAPAAVLSVGASVGAYGGNMCADVTGGSLTLGASVQVYDCNGAPNQQFEWSGRIPTDSVDVYSGSPIYALGGQRCLDTITGTVGHPVVSNVCDGGTTQRWDYLNGSLIQRSTGEGAILCLDAGNMANGTQLGLNPCGNTPTPPANQNWQIK